MRWMASWCLGAFVSWILFVDGSEGRQVYTVRQVRNIERYVPCKAGGVPFRMCHPLHVS
jgi:hypothetical protein